MPIKDFEEKRLENSKEEEDLNQSDSDQNSNKPAKKLLAGTVQFYEDILVSLHKTMIIVFNQSGKHIEVWSNPELKNVYGFSPDELEGKLIEDILDEANANQLKTKLNQVFESQEANNFRLSIQYPKGLFWFDITLTPLKGTQNKATSVIGYFRDISDFIKREEELEAEKEKYRNLIELAPEGILTVNNKGTITSVNITLLEMSGFNEKDFVCKKISRLPFLQPKDTLRFKMILDGLMNEKIPGTFELEWIHQDGSHKWSETYISPIKKRNKLSGYHIIFNDITERKIIERDLLKSKQAYKIIIENAHEAIYILQDDMVRFCNSRLLSLLNSTMDELQKTSFAQYIHPLDAAHVEKIFNDRFFGKHTEQRFTCRIINKKGEIKWFDNNAVLLDWDGKPAILVFATDITEGKRSEEKEKKYLKSLEFLSEKTMEFAEFKTGQNIYEFLGQKIKEITGESIILLVSYDYFSDITKIEHVESSEEPRAKLLNLINSKPFQFNIKLNHELIKSLSFGKLIKYNDGLFEIGNNIFPRNTYNLIQKLLHVGDIYLIGLTWENVVYGNAMIMLPENQKLDNPEAIETVVKLGSIILQRKQTEDALRNSEEKFRRIFESYQDVYYKVDIDGTILEVSPSVLKVGGYTQEEILGKSIYDFFDNKPFIKSFARILLKKGVISDQDIKLIDKDGRMIDASLNARLLKNENGIPVGSEGVIRDISERKKAEYNYQKSEEKFRTLADFTYDWEYWVAPDDSIVYISPSCERISGYTAEEFINNPELLISITHTDDVPLYINHVSEEESDRDVIKFDYRIVTKDKKVKWISHICQKVYGKEGDYLGRRATNRDITDRVLAEEELRNSEERFKTLFFESPDAVFVEDYDGNILDANPAACRLQKMEKEELVGKNIMELIPSSHKDQVAHEFPKWITGELMDYRGYSKTSDGLCIPVDIHTSKVRYFDKNALLLIVRDITKIKETEDLLKNAARNAEEADMLKSVFLANMSHEIRTPMNAIIGFSEILSDQELTKKERQEFINYITQGSNTLMNLIEDIIDITKIEAGQIKINFAECDVDKLMDELYATFLKMKDKNGKEKLELRLNKPMVEEGFSITTDPSRIRQILSNLLGNALKFTESGFIELGFTRPSENEIDFYVKDTGIGIPKDKQDLIFERFGQIEEARTRNKKGTGLGLSISKKLSELLGGKLSVDSELNAGSTFHLSLPVKKDYKKELPKEKPAISKPVDWSNKLFLIAEDSILNYTYLEALFQKTKVNLLWAKDGMEAVEMCKNNQQINLVLMDIKMPILDGLEAITEIKKFRKDLPIIVQTAYAMPEDRDKSLAAGGDEYLTKPINSDELFKTINKFLN